MCATQPSPHLDDYRRKSCIYGTFFTSGPFAVCMETAINRCGNEKCSKTHFHDSAITMLAKVIRHNLGTFALDIEGGRR